MARGRPQTGGWPFRVHFERLQWLAAPFPSRSPTADRRTATADHDQCESGCRSFLKNNTGRQLL